MARRGARKDGKHPILVLDGARGYKTQTTSVGTTVIALPATNWSYRTGMVIQNNHASQILYVGGDIPDILIGSISETDGVPKKLQWMKSATGNEWYAVSESGGDPSLTETKIMYYAVVGDATETLATNGTAGALAAEHNWDWAADPTAAFNTIYIRTNGAEPANSPSVRYETILSYTFTLTAGETSTGGMQIAPGADWPCPLDGSSRLFAVASGASTPVCTFEIRS